MKSIGKIKSLGGLIAAMALTIQSACAAPAPSLSNYPKSPRIWLGIDEAVVRPKAYSQGRSQIAANVRVVATDGQKLQKGDLWAVLDPQGLALEQRALEVDEYKFTQKLRDDKKNQREKNAQSQKDLSEIEQKKSRLRLALETEETPVEFKVRIREAIRKADEEIALLQDSLTPEQQAKDLQMSEEEARVVLEKKRKDFEAIKKRSELVAESDGILKLSAQAKEKLHGQADGLIWLDSNVLIGSISDEESVEIVISAKSPLVSQTKKEELLVLMEEGRSGKLISADFEKVDEKDTGADVQANYVFQVTPDSTAGAQSSIGQRNLVNVYRKLPEPCYIILKKDLVFLDSATLESSGWQGLVEKLWPGSQIVQIASQTIAIRAPDGN